jgi:hypothetical protein
MNRICFPVLVAVSLTQLPSAHAKQDPDLYKPQNTTGGAVGFGVGLAAGTVYGGPEGGVAGATAGALIGHGVDRAIVHTTHVTGPYWHKLEKKYGKSLSPKAITSELPKKIKKPKWL